MLSVNSYSFHKENLKKIKMSITQIKLNTHYGNLNAEWERENPVSPFKGNVASALLGNGILKSLLLGLSARVGCIVYELLTNIKQRKNVFKSTFTLR